MIPHLRIFAEEIIRAADKDLEAKMANAELLTTARKTGTINGFFPFQQRLSMKHRTYNIRSLAFDLQETLFLFFPLRNEQQNATVSSLPFSNRLPNI